MTRDELRQVFEQMFEECMALREAGQREYARAEDNAFGNFERVAEWLGITREQALLVYLLKHLDGIASYVEGHESQREDVRGRINDAVVYLGLLRGMVEQNEKRYGAYYCEICDVYHGTVNADEECPTCGNKLFAELPEGY